MRPRLASALFLSIRVVLASPFFKQHNGPPHEEPEKPGSPEFYEKLIISAVLVVVGGIFAGLTLGLMGLDELHLRVLSASSDDPVEKRNAATVLRLLEKGRHWVLVVLLLGNVIVNESLPIFLDSALGGGLAAVVISTTAIVIFGSVLPALTFLFELTKWDASLFTQRHPRIIPQALSVRYGLSIGARCAPLVLGMMYFFAPIAWPIAKLLDLLLGKNETNTYKKAELKSFLQFHRTGEEPLRDDEITILNGVLELNTKDVQEIMTPLKDTVILSADTILDHKAVDKILLSGYSRFPVHEPGNSLAFIGTLLVKKLLTYDPSKGLPVSSFPLTILPEALPTINCFQALDYFQTGRAHLLLISKTPGKAGGALGVITLEDIIEEIISEEIVDETDRYEDNRSKRKARRATTATIMRGIVERERRRPYSTERSPLIGATDVSRSNSVEGRAYGTIREHPDELTGNGQIVLSESPRDS
ncbi:hypothetical protein EST38_g6374 [Candolleomyces aberdarensis]|uniref:CNNM transmembrane domain-containing protein n=1 Tax=Candolleomyces aberdarensis TaxID=2316362 RepID=A0A4Q2DHZ5_9AGAR|nr:hypothetical protein EST38_g6374 [Candolleomyces aberdarensis]